MRHYLLAAILLSLPIEARADSLTFNNGDHLSGTIIKQTLTEYIFQTDFGAKITIPKSQIARLEISERIEDIEPASGNDNDMAMQTTKRINWSGEASIGANLQTGNSEKHDINFDTKVVARRVKDRFTVKFDYDKAEEDGDTTEDEATLEGIYDYFYRPKWFITANTLLEKDSLSDLELKSRYGLGVGHQAYETDHLNLKYALTGNYLREEFEGNTATEDSFAIGWALDYDQKFWDGMLRAFHGHELDIPTDDAEGFLFDSETGIKVPVMEKLVGTFAIEFDWDNDPAIGVREEDTKYKLKIGYKW